MPDRSTLLFDYTTINSQEYVQYYGSAPFGVDANEPRWLIYRFSYDGQASVTGIDIRPNAAWANRADPSVWS